MDKFETMIKFRGEYYFHLKERSMQALGGVAEASKEGQPMTKWQDKTRGGTTYRIIGRMTDPCFTKYSLLGEVQTVDGVWMFARWTDDGVVLGDGEDRSHDLIPVFHIDKPGWYKTRDGRRVLIGWIDDREGIDYPCVGRLGDSQAVSMWRRDGTGHNGIICPGTDGIDIIGKLEDE